MPSSPRSPLWRRKTSFRSTDSNEIIANFELGRRHSGGVNSSGQSTISSPSSRILSSFNGPEDGATDNATANEDGTLSQDQHGNLAEELAGAWEDDGEETTQDENDESHRQSTNAAHASLLDKKRDEDAKSTTYCEKHVGGSANHVLSEAEISTISSVRGMKTDDPDDSRQQDFMSNAVPSLEGQVKSVADLLHDANQDQDGREVDVLDRVAEALRDLPSQAGIENWSSRLITAHTALAAHIANQTKVLQSLSHQLLSPLLSPPSIETVDELLPLLTTLLMTLPSPNMQCTSSIHGLRTATSDLQTTLTYLSDTIYMTRQNLFSASRKLRSATDIMLEARRDASSREEAIRWIEKGAWQDRLGSRECGAACKEVLGGFEDACRSLTGQLVEGSSIA